MDELSFGNNSGWLDYRFEFNDFEKGRKVLMNLLKEIFEEMNMGYKFYLNLNSLKSYYELLFYVITNFLK